VAERTHEDPGIVPRPILVAACDARLVHQPKNKRENDSGGDRLAELHEQEERCWPCKMHDSNPGIVCLSLTELRLWQGSASPWVSRRRR
jgi:hypothetical protein